VAATRNISIYQGDSYAHELRLKTSASVAIDISTRTYAGQIRKRRGSDTITATFTSSPTNLAGGIVTLSLPASITAGLAAGTYVYDFQETSGTSVTTLVTGTVTVTGEVNRV